MIRNLKVFAKLPGRPSGFMLAFSILLTLPNTSFAETPSLATYLRDRSDSVGRDWEAVLTLDTLTTFSDRCDSEFKRLGDQGLIGSILLKEAVNEALSDSLSLLLMTRAITQISQSPQIYERLSPTIDEIGGLYYADFASLQQIINSSDCYDLNDRIDGKSKELYVGMSQSLFTVVELYVDAFKLENWRLLVGTNVPSIKNLEIISDETALERSSGRVLLHVGTNFSQDYFGSIVRNLVHSDIKPEVFANEGSDTLKIYFYSNELPDPYSASQITAAKQIIVDLLDKYADEIEQIERSAN